MMPDLGALASIGAVYMLGLLIPGPNFLIIANSALAGGRRAGLAATAGVVAVNALWASASLFGLGVVLRAFPGALAGLRLAGAAYLVWLGVGLVRSSGRLDPSQGEPSSAARAFRLGVATNIANAKAVVFYASIFSAAAPPQAAFTTLAAGVLLVLAMSFAWYGGFAMLLSSERVVRRYARSRRSIALVSGGLMIAFGVVLAVYS